MQHQLIVATNWQYLGDTHLILQSNPSPNPNVKKDRNDQTETEKHEATATSTHRSTNNGMEMETVLQRFSLVNNSSSTIENKHSNSSARELTQHKAHNSSTSLRDYHFQPPHHSHTWRSRHYQLSYSNDEPLSPQYTDVHYANASTPPRTSLGSHCPTHSLPRPTTESTILIVFLRPLSHFLSLH